MDVTLDDDATHPAASVVDGPFVSSLHRSMTSLVGMEAAKADTCIVDSIAYISECDDRKLSWVQQQSSQGIYHYGCIFFFPFVLGTLWDFV